MRYLYWLAQNNIKGAETKYSQYRDNQQANTAGQYPGKWMKTLASWLQYRMLLQYTSLIGRIFSGSYTADLLAMNH